VDINFEKLIEYVKENPDCCDVKFDEKGNLTSMKNGIVHLDAKGNICHVERKKEGWQKEGWD